MPNPTTFLHTADWQLGKPFAGIEDIQKRSLVQRERIHVLQRIATAAQTNGAEFIVVAGDVFDSPSATKSTVSAACAAIGAMQLPVFVIPGNHDCGGPGSLWEQPFFQHERAQLAPNLTVLLTAEPVVLENTVLFPCPLLRRQEAQDTTAWLRSDQASMGRFGERARVILAHGSVHGFGPQSDAGENSGSVVNQIALSLLPGSVFDYIALGDWHGMKQVGDKAWYSGTPEMDRFPRGPGNEPGHVLIVKVERHAAPVLTPVRTAGMGWHQLAFHFSRENGLDQLEEQLTALISSRAQQDLLLLQLGGSLGIEATSRVEEKLIAWQARLLRLKLQNQTQIEPDSDEIEALTGRASDPLISRVASKLASLSTGQGEEAALALVALRELHTACR